MRRRILSSNKKAADYLAFTAQGSGTFKFTKDGLSYSTDGTTWTALAANTYTPTIAAGSKIYFKGTMIPEITSGIGTFSSTGNFTVSGNIMSLLYGNNLVGKTSLSGKGYAFSQLFKSCTKLKSIDDLSLPATTLATGCYRYMFQGCTGLTSIPTGFLPATTLAGCPNCYASMFNDCRGLTSIPSDLLPATTLEIYCYSAMFQGCTGLTSIPSDLLPATILAQGCYYYMFYHCSKIITAPDLRATPLKVECYYCMFQSCTKLKSIRMLAESVSAKDCLTDWVKSVASSGTFYKKSGVTIPTGTSGIPSSWRVVNE